MLILGRDSGESIIIGDDITVTVIKISGNQVRLGISAPRDVTINREEIHLKIKDKLKDNDDKD